MSPIVRGKKGEHQKLLDDAKKMGFVKARIDGLMVEIDDTIKLDKQKKHSIELVIDRLILSDDIRQRLADSVEVALDYSQGMILVSRQVISDELDENGKPLKKKKKLFFLKRILVLIVVFQFLIYSLGFFLLIILSVPALNVLGWVKKWNMILI